MRATAISRRGTTEKVGGSAALQSSSRSRGVKTSILLRLP